MDEVFKNLPLAEQKKMLDHLAKLPDVRFLSSEDREKYDESIKVVHSAKDNKPLRRAERQHTRGALLILGSNGIHRDMLLPKIIFYQWGDLFSLFTFCF